MTEPLVSTKMITYNHASSIARAIEGVLQQKTSFPFELVIGEDCSTDGTREIVLDYQKKYPGIVRVITSEANVGAIKNGRRTAKACRGKYLAFCEGDDFWHHPAKMQKQADYLESHPDCGLICSDYDELFVGTGKRLRNRNKSEGRDPSRISDIRYIVRGTPTSGILTCTVMAQRDLLEQILDSDPFLFDNEKQPCGDTPLWTAFFERGCIAYIDESLATYNRHTASATRNPDARKVLRTSILMKEQMLYLAAKHHLPEAERKKHLGDLWRRKLKLAFYERDPAMAGEARKALGRLTPVEVLQVWGARNARANSIIKPVVELVSRTLIPTGK